METKLEKRYIIEKSYSFRTLVFSLLFSVFSPLYAPPVVVPNLNTPVFNATSMDQTFNVANGMQTVGNWDAFVFQGVSILQTQWEAQVQAQITMMVNSVTTSDHYASVQEYQTFVYNSLQSKASEQLIVWQTAVEAEILQERSQYLSQKYGANSSAVQNSTSQFQSQWDSFVSGNGLNLNTNGSLSQAVLNNGQQTLEGLEGQWWNDFQNNLQSGLQTYQQALAGLTEKYQNLINQINQTELQYQAHLTQIQQSQAGIKDQILSSLEGYQSYLNSNGLFWNTMSVVYDNNTNSYVQGSCPGGHICVTYQYDSVTSQFYTAGNCPVGHVCANILYDNNTSSYVQASCPATHVCDGAERENLTVRTGLNSDGRAFQSVINNVVNAMQDGFIMPAIFDYTTGTMISYNSNCMNTGTSCVKGLYDATSGGFVAGTTCAAGHTCYSAVVDNTNPAAMTGSYFANSCTVGDTRCVTCQAGHSCQVQDMEASFMYASSMMSNFLHNELLATQGALQSAINYQNGSGSSSYTYGQGVGSYDNSALSYQWGPSSFNHFSANVSQTTAAMTISELFDPSTTEGEGGLGKKIIQYITGQISQVEFANWIMNAYESNLTGAGSGLSGLGGLGPGMTISGISHADLRAFLNEDIPPANSGVNQYCPDPIGCYSGNIFAPDPGIYGANATFSERGYDFNRYIARELGVWAGVPFLVDIEHYQDYAWIELSFTVTNNNAYANVSTYQDLVLQLQSFEHDWMTNVMPSVTNWTAQVASYNAQYANWQTQMQTAITDAQNAYNSGVQDIQNQESSWLAQMGQLQQQAQSAFDAASNALKNGQGQGNYGQLTQQILAGLNKGQLQSNISNSTDTMQYGDGFSNILNNLDRNADRGIPNFSLLNSFGSSMSRAITGVSNLTLLSSTNNALMDNILGYMQGVAESMRNEKQFTQNGQQDLMEAHGLKTKTIKTRDKYSGEEISTTYVLDESGNIRMFKDEDGVEKQMTVGDWIQSDEGCGKNLMNGNCNQYIENKYDSVAISTDGKITAHRKIYNGTTTQCGADFAQSSSYCYNEDDRVITIAPPNPKALLLGRGASRLGDIFDGRDNGIGDLVNTTFQNVGTYLSSNKHTADLFHEVITAQNLNDMNASIASQDVSNKVKIANLIVDYAQAVLLSGMSTGSWVTKQANQAVQDVISTALVNTFDLPPDVAAFISGGLMAHMEASKAKHDLGTKNFGIGKGIHSAFNDLGLEGLESALIHAAGPILDVLIFPGAGAISKSTLDSYGNDLDSMHKWKEFKTSMYGFAVQKIGEQQHWSPEFTSFASQYAMDYIEMKEAKAELGRNGAAFSLNSIAGEVKLAIANVGGAFGEYLGGIVNGAAHISGDLGLTSERYEKEINQQVRTSINDIKLKGYKDNIRNWDADQVGLASATVKEYGRVNHIDQATIDLWSQQASDFVVRKQAERDLHRRESQMLTATVLTGGLAGVLVLDNKLFSGGLTSLVSKGIKGVMTTIADVGNLLGEGVVSSSFRDSVYDQSKQWHKTITQEDVKARTQQGIINKAHIESEMRNQLFDVIGETLIPGDKEAAHNLGLLLKHHIDQKEAKKAAKEQRLRDAQTVVQVAAAAAMVACSAGTTGPLAGTWLSGLTTAASTTVAGTTVTLTYGQIAALAVSTAVSMGVEGSINGTNGAVAAFANGLISAATMGIKTPVTGYVTYTKHQNANLLTGQHEVKGGWGGGFSANIAGSKALPLGEAMQAFAAAMKMSNLSLGLSYNRDAGLGMNVNANFTNHLGLGLDYNFKSGDYTASASYDFDKIGDKDWANASLGISASKNGHASASISYNTDGNTAIPQALRGSGATLDFGNDGLIGLSVQAMRGATIGTLTYDTNTHGFQPLTLNSNYQNEFNQGQAAENAAYNHQKGQMEILRKELGLGTNMDKPLFTDAEIDKALPKDEHGNIDMEKANPEKLLEKWNAHKEAMSKTPEGLQKWKDEVSKAGERSGIEVRFNDGKSATTTFGKFVTGLMGDVAQSFGFANDGSKMVDEQGVFHLDTCFVAGTSIRMDSGFKAIEDVKIGDVVRSWNENTNTFENKRVTQAFVHEVPQLFFLELDGEEEIHTTWNHPFRRKTQNTQEVQPFDLRGVERSFTTHEHVMNPGETVLQKRNTEETASLSSEWVKVEDLRLRDQVLRSDGSWGTVTGIYYYNTESTKVYNLEVEDNHTYIVGGSETGKGYVVHNYIVDQKDKFLSEAEVKKAYADHKKMGEKAEIKWGDKTYKKVNGEGDGVAVFVRDYDEKGTKEYIRITKDGLIEQKIKWKGQLGEFMADTLSGEKTKYFNTRGEEVFLQPTKLTQNAVGDQKPSLRIPSETKTLDHTVAENLRRGEGQGTREISWNNNTYKKQINERTGAVSYTREYSRGVKEEIRITHDNHIEQKLSWTDQFGFGKKEEKVVVFEANGNERKFKEKILLPKKEIELTQMQKAIHTFTNDLASDKHFNNEDKAKASELREKLFNAPVKDRTKLLDELKKLKIESYVRENKLVNELEADDRAKLLTNLNKIYSGSKDVGEASNIVSNLLQKAAGGMTESSFPNQTEFDKKINQGLRTAKNEAKIMIENQKDAFRKKFDSEMVYDKNGNFDIKYSKQDPEYVGFDGISELTEYNSSNQNKSNNYTTMKEGKAGLTGKLHDTVDMMRQELKEGTYYYQEELNSAVKNKQTLDDLQTLLKSKEKGISESITSLSSEISKLKKDKNADPNVLTQKVTDLENRKQSLSAIKDQIVDTGSLLKKADSQISYFESRKATFEESKKWFNDKNNTIDTTKGIASGICYAWSDYAMLKSNNLEKRPFDVWYREQVKKGNLSFSTTQAGGAGVFYGKIEATGDGLLAGYEVDYISNKVNEKDAWNDKVWQPMNYSDTMKTLKDQGIKTFKVWIDKTEYSKGKINGTYDQGGQHYFIVAWDESKGKFMMMDHNNNSVYHEKPLTEDYFKQIRKITYIKPKRIK
ncbi:toxin HINT domain protein [Leptospira kirschneri serovar Mozdok]|uniref:TIGR04388 family protein n=5 Tax=Leptospira kirschneri TaxID=29507 RepID=UPI000531F55A|nr:TIGR04388 family protein [Leptospira kirschneri]KPZ76003.1 toxin HINT domain protein [Leptospira kirschneri serovar Mozdok]NDK05048.1 Toxin HINT domain protein [Leptospira kirschneri serovar Mozdok]